MQNNGNFFYKRAAICVTAALTVFSLLPQPLCTVAAENAQTQPSENGSAFEAVIGVEAVTELNGAQLAEYDGGAFTAVEMRDESSASFE